MVQLSLGAMSLGAEVEEEERYCTPRSGVVGLPGEEGEGMVVVVEGGEEEEEAQGERKARLMGTERVKWRRGEVVDSGGGGEEEREMDVDV